MSRADASAITVDWWVGWYRRRKDQPWRAVAEAPDYGECWHRLLDILADGRGGESTVLPAGRSPDQPPAGPAERASWRRGESFPHRARAGHHADRHQ